jgi:hypothetical protein
MTIPELIEKYKDSAYITNLPEFVQWQCSSDCHKTGQVYKCKLCQREVPFCFGCDDEFTELCDDCAVMAMAEANTEAE